MNEQPFDVNQIAKQAIAMQTGMYEALIKEFMKETGLKPSEIMLVETFNAEGYRYYYVKRKDPVERENGCKMVIIFDDRSWKWRESFEQNNYYVQSTLNYANGLFKTHGYLYLNDVRSMLGMTRPDNEALLGWVYDERKKPVIEFEIDDKPKDKYSLVIRIDQPKEIKI